MMRLAQRPLLAGQRPTAVRQVDSSDLSLLGHLKRIVDLNAEISNCAFKFGMAK
jgi:hypothetical protein